MKSQGLAMLREVDFKFKPYCVTFIPFWETIRFCIKSSKGDFGELSEKLNTEYAKAFIPSKEKNGIKFKPCRAVKIK